MASIVRIKNGEVTSVYDDTLAPLYAALGIPVIERATDVEYDSGSQTWVAVHRDTGTVISSGSVRSQVIKDEVKWLEERL